MAHWADKEHCRSAHYCECGHHAFAATTKGYVALVSPEDAHLFDHKWFAIPRRNGVKLQHCTPDRKYLILSRGVTGASGDEVVDHINRNTLDNTRGNLRVCTVRENAWNRVKPQSKVLPKGVSLNKGRFRAMIRYGAKVYSLGTFTTVEEARAAYEGAAKVLHGEYFRSEPDPYDRDYSTHLLNTQKIEEHV